jgi:putative methionine-R-sulfoxide reductase with GAF domain
MGGHPAAQGDSVVAASNQAIEQLRSALAAPDANEAKARRTAELIRDRRNYCWAGIYEINREAKAAIAWTGPDPPAFPRFPKTQGLCGVAVRARRTMLVGEVTKDPRYLTTFGSTKSEIVVPVYSRAGKTALGLIDVESERLNAFGDAERAFLEGCAALVTGLWE